MKETHQRLFNDNAVFLSLDALCEMKIRKSNSRQIYKMTMRRIVCKIAIIFWMNLTGFHFHDTLRDTRKISDTKKNMWMVLGILTLYPI